MSDETGFAELQKIAAVDQLMNDAIPAGQRRKLAKLAEQLSPDFATAPTKKDVAIFRRKIEKELLKKLTLQSK